eukprot:CAMPEP_0201285938 /NCGR_PEP_ID=MMETSP1317-20130820/114044_1 /ASSEMBLY_ACC=CAM_ASM_000770 /TAXON_ID=187299 /ORGANISM="Undescribed Undescribed, Strain Undescribed" /LENGTH=40 /DNA_ID= /DNA_START= /DNA_END= /DNA_ORIENTATION=
MKDTIRMSFLELGDIHLDFGDCATAIKTFLKAKDYCTTHE